ncbi:MAG: CDP-diacylglycerol--glycerol-3-phosphate 3-phosphatidyltransferase [Coriobacteriia bacterium]|nr:CDP-diacylglycerol--glycerol-3-phosphate 3-phosphatidyltransferase [Coriobacteriia bacterium]MCL2871130.1 CDP-diacylglycerol--glycerol-3-phosphate 3-phosphatidyltransferase [Coriobacteriia bacterium]
MSEQLHHNREVTEKVFLKLSLASKITLARVLFIPLFLAVLLTNWPLLLFPYFELAYSLQPWLAALVFILIAATDAIDGHVARKRKEVTTFGKFIDPLADKLLVTAALLALVQMAVLPAWIAFIIVAREFIISGLRMVATANGGIIEVSGLGKLKTVLQSTAIVMFIVKDHTGILGIPSLPLIEQGVSLLAWAVMLAAVAITVVSLWDYYKKVSEFLNGPWTKAD